MPLTDDEGIERAQKAEREVYQAQAEAAKALIPVLEAQAKAYMGLIAAKKLALEQAIKNGGSSVKEEKELKDLEKQISKTAGALKNAQGAIKGNTEANRGYLLILSEVAKQSATYVQAIEENILGYKELILTTKALERSVLSFGNATAGEQKQLNDLKSTLRLTRQEYALFIQSYSKGADLGIKVDQVKALAKQLTDVRGQAEGLKALDTLMKGNLSSRTLQKAAAGDKNALAAASRVADRSQRGALADLSAAPDSDAKNSMWRAGGEKFADELKATFSENIDQLTFGLAGWLGPNSALLIAAGAQIVQLQMIHSALLANGGGGGGGMLSSLFGGGAGGAGKLGKVGKFGTKMGKAAGPVAILGLLAEVGGDWMKGDSDEGTGKHVGGAALSAGGNIAGMAGTGALVGSILGPLGTIAGGIVGAGIGIYQSWGDISEVGSFLKSGFEDLTMTTDQLIEKMEKEKLAKDIKETSILAVTQAGEVMRNALKAENEQAKEGLSQERGRTAQMLMGAIGSGGGNAGEILGQKQAGIAAQNSAMLPNWQDESFRISNEKNRISGLQRSGKLTPEQLAESKISFELLDTQAEQLKQDMMKVAAEMDFSSVISTLDQRSQNLLVGVRSEKDRMEARVSAYGNLSGSMDQINEQQELITRAANAELAQNEEKLQILTKMQASQQALLESQSAIDPSIRAENDIKIEAMKMELANKKEQLETEKQAADIAKKQAAFAAIRAIAERSQNSLAYKQAEASGSLAEAGLGLASARGGSGASMGALAAEFAVSQQQMLEILKTNSAASLAAINEKYNAEMTSTDATVRANAELAKLDAETKIRTDLLRQEIAVTQANINTSKVVYDKERALIGVRQESLAIEKDLSEYLGSSYSTIFAIQGEMLNEQILAHQQTASLMSKMVEELGEGAKNTTDYQQLQTQYAKESAEITKNSLGRQRDFLDKALGKAFGVGSGSKFNPVMNDRMMFGEHMTQGGRDGFRVGGQSQTIGERERRLAQRGAQRPLAPLGGGGGGFGQGLGGGAGQIEMGPGAPGFAAPGGAQAAVRGPAQAMVNDIDISGRIDVTVDLRTNMLTAMVERIINMRQRRGNS